MTVNNGETLNVTKCATWCRRCVVVIVIYRHLPTYGMIRRNSCICYLNICTSSNARSRDEGCFSRQGNIMQHNTCSVCTSFSGSHITAFLFIHSKTGTVHVDEHLHANAPDYSHRLISIRRPPGPVGGKQEFMQK